MQSDTKFFLVQSLLMRKKKCDNFQNKQTKLSAIKKNEKAFV